MRSLAALAVAAALVAGPPPARAEDAALKEAARKALGRYGPALVMVRLTLKPRMVFEGREESGPESTIDTAGTLVTADGLTALSDFTTDPTAMFQREDGPRFETEVSDVRLLLQDGRELPARFVLRDSDLDVAFVAPVEPVTRLASVPFEKGALPGPMDDLVFLSQLGKSLNREVAVSTGQVRAVVKKPRTFLVPGSADGMSSLGTPAFDGKGRPVGLVVMRRAPGGQDGSFLSMRAFGDRLAAVVLTGADVQDLIVQAKAARAKLAAAQEGAAATAAP